MEEETPEAAHHCQGSGTGRGAQVHDRGPPSGLPPTVGAASRPEGMDVDGDHSFVELADMAADEADADVEIVGLAASSSTSRA